MFRIGEFSKLSSTSTRMLRHYEKMGLLTPESIDEKNGYRHYSAKQLNQINRIKKLQGLGLSLAMIKEILDTDDMKVLKKHLKQRTVAIEQELSAIQSQQKMLNAVQDLLEENPIDYHVERKMIPERHVMSLRRVIPDPASESALWYELFEEVQKQNVKFAEPMFGVSIYHDKEYQDKNIDIELQNTVDGTYQDTKEIKFFDAPAIEVAAITFHGSYEQMPHVMTAIGQWLEIHQYQIAGPMFNINHVSPAQDPDPDNWVTEACLAIEKQNL